MKKLIPALCMLLIVASMLGTSTYAWFSMNKEAYATGMEVTAQVQSALSISKTNSTSGYQRSVALTKKTGYINPVTPVLNHKGEVTAWYKLTEEGTRLVDANGKLTGKAKTVNDVFADGSDFILVQTTDTSWQTSKEYYSLKQKTVTTGASVTGYYVRVGEGFMKATGTAQSGVKYYENSFAEVTSPNVANIGTYFEKVGDLYSLTADTALEAGKTYYTANTTPLFEKAKKNFTKDIYSVTSDAYIEDSKTYYQFAKVASPVSGSLSTYYVKLGDTYLKASGTFNSEITYYTDIYSTSKAKFAVYQFTVVTSPASTDFAKYYVKDENNHYVKATGSYQSGTTYYINSKADNATAAGNPTVTNCYELIAGYYVKTNDNAFGNKTYYYLDSSVLYENILASTYFTNGASEPVSEKVWLKLSGGTEARQISVAASYVTPPTTQNKIKDAMHIYFVVKDTDGNITLVNLDMGSSSNPSEKIGSLKPSTSTEDEYLEVSIYYFLDGEDDQCANKHIQADSTMNVDLTFTAAD